MCRIGRHLGHQALCLEQRRWGPMLPAMAAGRERNAFFGLRILIDETAFGLTIF